MLNSLAISECYEQMAREKKLKSYFDIAVEVVDETGSTNADLLKRANDIMQPVLLIAKNQTAGRGRAGRTWHSVSEGVLTFSLAWKMDKTAQELMGISLVVGVVIAEKLIELGVPVKLKWPNDLLKDQKKMAGILIESQKTQDAQTCVIIGVGLNLSVPDTLEALIGQSVADSAWLASMDRNKLMAHLLYALSDGITTFLETGFQAFQTRWNQLNAHTQQMVNIIDHGHVVHVGQVMGVDEQGCLLLQTETGMLSIHTGDVSLRVANN
jgi:BirA family biotin operon repressor/biotin-[acetyl-CoA-carboxylase] ligase